MTLRSLASRLADSSWDSILESTIKFKSIGPATVEKEYQQIKLQ